MKLFWYESSSTYSEELYLVRAESLAHAKAIVNDSVENALPEKDWCEVTENGSPGILWSRVRSYDTGGEG